jgi:hypothetical protein
MLTYGEKYRQATKEAQENYDVGKKKHELERAELDRSPNLSSPMLTYADVC